MSSKRLLFKDRMSYRDTLELINPSNLWARTEVLLGYGYHEGSKFGKSYLDETIIEDENTVVLGGVQTALQHIFGVKAPITIPSLYEKFGIGVPDVEIKSSYLVPNHSNENDANSTAVTEASIYDPGSFVQLFGVGVTGSAENNITVPKVGYREMYIDMDSANGADTPNGIMYPFRYTASELDGSEKTKYFGKKLDPETGATAYYLKRFESAPAIRHVWKTQDNMDTENESQVTDATVKETGRNDAIESFAEMHLQITKKDLKEFFTDKLGQPESCRFNCIALFDGLYTEVNKPDSELFGDYANVHMFSKLNIPTEPLSLQKDLEIIYRVYGS